MPVIQQRFTPEVLTEERCSIIELMNSPSAAEASLALARVEPGITTRWHSVPVVEHYVILQGHGRMEIEGESATEVAPGQTVRIPAGSAQRIENLSEQALEFFCVCSPRFRTEDYRDLGDGPAPVPPTHERQTTDRSGDPSS